MTVGPPRAVPIANVGRLILFRGPADDYHGSWGIFSPFSDWPFQAGSVFGADVSTDLLDAGTLCPLFISNREPAKRRSANPQGVFPAARRSHAVFLATETECLA